MNRETFVTYPGYIYPYYAWPSFYPYYAPPMIPVATDRPKLYGPYGPYTYGPY